MFKEAVILAGGFGTRLRTVIEDVPKPMAPVNGKPFLEYLLRYLLQFNIKKVVLSVGYKHEVIKSYFGDEFFGIKIVYSVENEPLGTGGALVKALQYCNEPDVLVCNGDTYYEIDAEGLYHFHIMSKAEVTFCLRRMDNTSRYGTVAITDNLMIKEFSEKTGKEKGGLINGGVYAVKKAVFETGDFEEKFSLEKDYFEKEVNKAVFMAYVTKDYFIDIGIPEDYHKASHDFRRFEI
jgi:D-glycero-alpha-D-manno-heptose 1-phosphate guanylyltransferase